ncbi:DUF1307 domain-containing protein [Lacticaseibacillus camelliae]|uniref:Lipoprotein n=1 Tax=Lacticaseibacillus camelliae DSM 22697 = JCM 13995 TaxID=1423730 RepID=A0A0R2FJQ2_9LACO|nr:DUF1307 domain-containing protein [Lacticaseibacillus camelliae]KRN25319.1 hypothetical protein FC75_GL000681 [Lacticaseibacillus camelliae DSM 22697 = JCM 13995]
MKKRRARLASTQKWRRELVAWLSAFGLVVLLAGCSQAVHKTVFAHSGGGEKTTLAFYTKGRSDHVDKQVTTLDIDMAKVMGKSDAKTLDRGWHVMQADAQAHAKLHGVKATVARSGKMVHEVVTVDTAKVDFGKLAKVDGQALAGKTDHISLDNVTHTLKQDGYQEVK